MKILAFILSIYFLGLNLIPLACTDAEEGQQQQTEMSLQQGDGQQGSFELCPPLCSCHCCHLHVAEYNVAEFSVLEPEIPSKDFAYNQPSPEDIYTPLFQPPKI